MAPLLVSSRGEQEGVSAGRPKAGLHHCLAGGLVREPTDALSKAVQAAFMPDKNAILSRLIGGSGRRKSIPKGPRKLTIRVRCAPPAPILSVLPRKHPGDAPILAHRDRAIDVDSKLMEPRLIENLMRQRVVRIVPAKGVGHGLSICPASVSQGNDPFVHAGWSNT